MLQILSLLAAVAAVSASSFRGNAGPSLSTLFAEHEAAAVFESAGASSKGYVVAATWLNTPEVAQIFDVNTGEPLAKVAAGTADWWPGAPVRQPRPGRHGSARIR